jgi:hypothetical protein
LRLISLYKLLAEQSDRAAQEARKGASFLYYCGAQDKGQWLGYTYFAFRCVGFTMISRHTSPLEEGRASNSMTRCNMRMTMRTVCGYVVAGFLT